MDRKRQSVIRVAIEPKGKEPTNARVGQLIADLADVVLNSDATYKEICEACEKLPNVIASISRPTWVDPLEPRG